MKGVEAKAAAFGGKYKRAEKLLLDQLGLCNHDAVQSEEWRARGEYYAAEEVWSCEGVCGDGIALQKTIKNNGTSTGENTMRHEHTYSLTEPT